MEMRGEKAEGGARRDGRGRGEEEEEEDEEKIEKFFAILRNYREACNRRRSELMGELGWDNREEEQEKESKRKKRRLNGGLDVGRQCRSSSWIPRFELEDFSRSDVVEFRSRHPSAILPGPCIREEKEEVVEVEGTEKSEKVKKDGGLDLNLAL